MKRLYTIALAAAVALSSAAASHLTPMKGRTPEQHKAAMQSHKSVRPAHARDLKAASKTPAKVSALRKAPARSADAIYDPVGEANTYANTALGFSYGLFGIDYSLNTVPTEIVWGENDEVYIRDIVSMLESGGVYVKGRREGDKVIVDLPQVCYVENYDGELYSFYAMLAEYYEFEEDGELYMSYANVDSDDVGVTYTIGEDGSLTLDLNDPDEADPDNLPQYIIALVEDPTPGEDMWLGYGDSYQCYNVFDQEATTVPEGVQLQDWVMLANNLNCTAKVGFDGDDVYVTDFWEYNPEVTMKGHVEGDKVKFEMNRYAGMAEGFFIYLMAVNWTDESFEDYELLPELVMNYDAEGRIMSTDDPLIDLTFNVLPDEYYAADYYENPTFRYQNDEDTNAAPENPWVNYFEEYRYQSYLDAWEGYIDWIIPAVNVNGYMLPTDRMYYHLLADGEVMTLTTEDYPGFDEDVTDIPYDFGDDFDLQVLDDSHYFTFKVEGITTYGCQSFYKNDNGDVFASDIVNYSPAGISTIATDGKEVKAIEYYTIEGRRVANPGPGVYVVRYRLADGTTATGKVIK